MGNFIKRNISKDVLSIGINQIWRIFAGPITLLLIPAFISPEVQGYWYTFGSLSALSILADLGFSTIVLQFAAHEYAYLAIDDNGYISGDQEHLNRLASFFRFTVKWLALIVSISFPVIFGIGFYLMSQKTVTINWLYPWIIFIIGSGISFFTNTILYFFEGCGSLGLGQRTRWYISVISTLILWICLFAHFSLYSLALASVLSSAVGTGLIWWNFKGLIKIFMQISRDYYYSWKSEFFPLLGRYSISWASGYLIFQIYTPLMFHFHGAVEAGKVGISISLWTTIFSISNIWVYAATPRMNMLVSKKEWKDLDRELKRSLTLSLITYLLGIIGFICFIYLLSFKIDLLPRFASPPALAMLGAGWFCQMIINTIAVYLRAHKEEPFVLPSVISAIYIVIVTFLVARYLPAECYFLGFLTSYVFGLPWAVLLIHKKRRFGHKTAIE